MHEKRGADRPPSSLYIKALLSGWVMSAGVFMVIAVVQGYSIRSALLPVVIIAAIFTPCVGVPLVLTLGPAQGTASVRPTASLQLGDDYGDVFDRALEAVASLDGSRIVRADRSRGLIVAKVAPTWESFGEKLRLELLRRPVGVDVRLSSRPRMPLTVADYGKNERNLQTVVGHLTDSPKRTILDLGDPTPAPRPPLGVFVVGGAAVVLQLAFSSLFRRSGTGHMWFALANVGFLLVFFGSWLLAARRADTGVKVRVLAGVGAVLSVVGQLAALAK